MKEPPDWSRFDDRALQEAIATNAFCTSRDVARMLFWVQFMAGAVALASIRFLVF
jgi:hypothetical protein